MTTSSGVAVILAIIIIFYLFFLISAQLLISYALNISWILPGTILWILFLVLICYLLYQIACHQSQWAIWFTIILVVLLLFWTIYVNYSFRASPDRAWVRIMGLEGECLVVNN